MKKQNVYRNLGKDVRKSRTEIVKRARKQKKCENLGRFHALCKVRKLESSGFETVKEAEVDN